ncbi:5'-3' exonuclease PLD3-like isoform X2 [Phlebotomus argentipes]|uniref:5'-3' exonuclease PLD3-like isoform X2 n=1 Tax=Phlebotomus argentipes TaxID=94469 RepID=UPI0028937CA1|nr:5'-3' exonuclease PLD3-like isoform X2 [Phlebotomus argentipes]XP_059618535.1 5'-3' exonuclease PLD3-like isoform X2 [Phlebotomus argentipes]
MLAARQTHCRFRRLSMETFSVHCDVASTFTQLSFSNSKQHRDTRRRAAHESTFDHEIPRPRLIATFAISRKFWCFVFFASSVKVSRPHVVYATMKLQINVFDADDDKKSTVLESNTNTAQDDDFELWDQHSEMLREQQGPMWGHNAWCKPSCIPISVILILIVLVVLLPLLDHSSEKTNRLSDSAFLCPDSCNIQLVESIPEGLTYPAGSVAFRSTFDAWQTLIGLATKSIDIASFYWTLRSADVVNDSSSWQGEQIFQALLQAGTRGGIAVRVAQSAPTQAQPNIDTEILIKRGAAQVRSVNFPRLLGGGVLHTKLWIVDGQHLYLGSANMDWRSLTQVKELGVLATNCTCLAKDVAKIFSVYWDMGEDSAQIPDKWPDSYATKYNYDTPLRVNYNNSQFSSNIFFSSSPPPMSPSGREQDVDAIVKIIAHAEKFIHIAVMDYFPLTIYTPKIQFWPQIDNALRKAAIENKVSVKLLISWWNNSRPAEDYFLRSLEDISEAYKNVNVQIKRFIVPKSDDQARIPFARVNHNKYMVTDNVAFVGTSNWSGDYFIDTAGIGLVMMDPEHGQHNMTESESLRLNLAAIFDRDWNSAYAVNVIKKVAFQNHLQPLD